MDGICKRESLLIIVAKVSLMVKKVKKKKVSSRKKLSEKEAKAEYRKVKKEMEAIRKATSRYIEDVSKIVEKHHTKDIKGIKGHIRGMKRKLKSFEKIGRKHL